MRLYVSSESRKLSATMICLRSRARKEQSVSLAPAKRALLECSRLTITTAANELIATLKAQLASKAEVVKESQALRQQLDDSNDTIERLQAEVNSLQGSLADARKEAKTLTTKLTAARTADSAAVKIPGSAMKGSTADKRMMANAEALVQAAQMKEDLYGDLTGLIIRGVKREEEEDVFDCLQTGRNGSKCWSHACERGKKNDGANCVTSSPLQASDRGGQHEQQLR